MSDPAEEALTIVRFLKRQVRELEQFAATYRAYEAEGKRPPGAPRALATKFTTRRAPKHLLDAAVDNIMASGEQLTVNQVVERMHAKGFIIGYSSVYERMKKDATLERLGRLYWRPAEAAPSSKVAESNK